MHRLKGERLYVNLSAAAARARLSGRGLGVRKVHSAGHHQAVVIHTAAGRHLEALQNLFADVCWATTEAGLAQPLAELKNLGPTRRTWLMEAGIRSLSDLRRLGAVAAFRLVQRKRPECGLDLLWALAAGLEGRDWRELSTEEKALLLEDLESR
jgi:DNA transformation protein